MTTEYNLEPPDNFGEAYRVFFPLKILIPQPRTSVFQMRKEPALRAIYQVT